MFVCLKCGGLFPLWKPICPSCSMEGTLEKKLPEGDTPQDETATKKPERLPSGFPFFDAVFNGGFLRAFLYFLHAERGAGKTTFLLKVCANLVSLGYKVVYYSFDEGADGMKKKCLQYGLTENLPFFIFSNESHSVERTLREQQPDFVVLDSLQSFAQYDYNSTVSELAKLRKKAQRDHFCLVVVGEERRDKKGYLGSASIGHIIDVQVKLVKGINSEVIISTPEKNRDTDDRTSRCFFRRTTTGLIGINESETSFLHRHTETEIIGLASFVTKNGDDFSVDEITAAIIDRDAKKPSLTIAGMSQAKSRNLLAVINTISTLSNVEITLRAIREEKLNVEAELACVLAVLSVLFEKPLPVSTVYVGGVDNRCNLLPIDGMEQRVKRAKALGYKRVIGPRAIGSQTVVWDEFDTLESLKQEFFR